MSFTDQEVCQEDVVPYVAEVPSHRCWADHIGFTQKQAPGEEFYKHTWRDSMGATERQTIV